MNLFGKIGKKFTIKMLDQKELLRYSRHIKLPEVGLEGQEKLKQAKVLVIGAGGLGCPVLQYLTAAGVGIIGLVEFDTVDASNLQRQILFNVEDIGKPKAEVAIKKLKMQNPHISFNQHPFRLDTSNALETIKNYDLIVDGCDNFATRYLVNDTCVILNKPFVFGSIFKFEGHVSVFNLSINGQKGPTYRCLFPEPPSPEEAPDCATIGVIGILPGIIGSLQANEAIKIILGIGEPLSGKFLVMDALTLQFHTIKFKALEKNQNIKALKEDYEEFCGSKKDFNPSEYKEVSVQDLKKRLDSGEDIFLLDVREDYEHEICNIGGLLAPMDDINKFINIIPKDKPVVVYCHHGMRSAAVIKYLQKEYSFTNLLNLEGGIHKYAVEIDEDLEVY